MNSSALVFQEKIDIYDKNSRWLNYGFWKRTTIDYVLKFSKHFLSSLLGGV